MAALFCRNSPFVRIDAAFSLKYHPLLKFTVLFCFFYLLQSRHTSRNASQVTPPSSSLLARWTQCWLHSSKEITQVCDRNLFLQTSVTHRGLKRCFRDFWKGKQSRSIRHSAFTHLHSTFTCTQHSSHVNRNIHVHTLIYMHSLGFSHTTES